METTGTCQWTEMELLAAETHNTRRNPITWIVHLAVSLHLRTKCHYYNRKYASYAFITNCRYFTRLYFTSLGAMNLGQLHKQLPTTGILSIYCYYAIHDWGFQHITTLFQCFMLGMQVVMVDIALCGVDCSSSTISAQRGRRYDVCCYKSTRLVWAIVGNTISGVGHTSVVGPTIHGTSMVTTSYALTEDSSAGIQRFCTLYKYVMFSILDDQQQLDSVVCDTLLTSKNLLLVCKC